tara:strand:- start:377 stop:655 length:279 start_codon:yes stop_codon:yes gene_type:complete
MLSRRLFFNLPIVYSQQVQNKYKSKPSYEHKSKDYYDRLFVSNNEKLKIRTTFDDYNECVVVTNYIEWEDPITETTMSKQMRELYLLEKDQI